jgi:hypothetical protein
VYRTLTIIEMQYFVTTGMWYQVLSKFSAFD